MSSVKEKYQDAVFPFVDTLYDYVQFLRRGPITIGPVVHNKRVAIVGAGAAGLTAAYELLHAGIVPTIFEASGRIGGRCMTSNFTDQNGNPERAFAEMGAMRFPVSSALLLYYLDTFGIETTNNFPNPGQVPTLLYYQKQRSLWLPGADVPADFQEVSKKWHHLADPLLRAIYQPWEQHNLFAVRKMWQHYIDEYGHISFYEALRQAGWSQADIARFGALGIGTGGFDSLYQVSFLEILRIMINRLEVDQRQLTDGTVPFLQKFIDTTVMLPSGDIQSLAVLNCLKLNHRVLAVRSSQHQLELHIAADGSTPRQEIFDAVIVATTTKAMHTMNLANASNLLPLPVRQAIRSIYMIPSSKMFIRTKTKFWRTLPALPRVILTDELPRATYTIDNPDSKNGIVCMSYTWGDSARALSELPVDARFAHLKRIIAQISPDFAQHLVPLHDQIYNVDWHTQAYSNGGFKLPLPGQNKYTASLYSQFLAAMHSGDPGLYLAGDSVSWNGGWIEGALQTGVNAACAAAFHCGATVRPWSPLTQNAQLYDYQNC